MALAQSPLLYFLSDWGMRPETKESIPQQDISEEDSFQGAMRERLSGNSPWDPMLCETCACEGHLERHSGQVAISHKRNFREGAAYECSAFEGSFSLQSILVSQQGIPTGESLRTCDTQVGNLMPNLDRSLQSLFLLCGTLWPQTFICLPSSFPPYLPPFVPSFLIFVCKIFQTYRKVLQNSVTNSHVSTTHL